MKLHDLLRSIGSAPFRSESGHPQWDAQRNLMGRTHYVDDDTLKGFKARILDAGLAHDGLTYWLIESVGSKPTDPRRNKRFVAFDVFGTCLVGRNDWKATSAQCDKLRHAWIDSFDAVAHTEQALRERAKRLKAEFVDITATVGRAATPHDYKAGE